MKISNKVIVIALILVIIILLGWSWLNEKQKSETINNVSSENNISQQNLNNINSINNTPQIIINYPVSGVLLNPGPTFINYTLAGNLEEVKRLDLMVLKKGGEIQRMPGFFNKESKTGSQIVSLTSGEYQLIARLVKNDESFFNAPFSETTISFMVREMNVNK